MTVLTKTNHNASQNRTNTDEQQQPQWDAERACLLLKSNDEEIREQHFEFFGKLTIEVFYHKGKITGVELNRKQTFKN